jgi:chorismate mutase
MLESIRWRKENVQNEDFLSALEKLRQQINQLDDELLQVLSTRMKVAQKIGEYKKNNDITILQTNRWNEILDRAIAKGNNLGLSDEFVTKYMDAVHMESINQQNKIMNN